MRLQAGGGNCYGSKPEVETACDFRPEAETACDFRPEAETAVAASRRRKLLWQQDYCSMTYSASMRGMVTVSSP